MEPKTETAAQDILTARLKYGPKLELTGATLAEISAKYEAARDISGMGASEFGSATVTDSRGHEVASVSYNGKVWPPGDWSKETKPLFNPYDKEA